MPIVWYKEGENRWLQALTGLKFCKLQMLLHVKSRLTVKLSFLRWPMLFRKRRVLVMVKKPTSVLRSIQKQVKLNYSVSLKLLISLKTIQVKLLYLMHSNVKRMLKWVIFSPIFYPHGFWTHRCAIC